MIIMAFRGFSAHLSLSRFAAVVPACGGGGAGKELSRGESWEGRSSRLCSAQHRGIISLWDAIWLWVWRLASRQAHSGSVPALVAEGEGGVCWDESVFPCFVWGCSDC